MTKPIVLTGHMATGKTAIGRRLASKLNRKFYDSDYEITVSAGMTVPEIFKKHGEPEFRRLEKSIICRLINETPDAIIAMGGGAIMTPEIQKSVFENTTSIWLKAKTETIIKRANRRKGSRPLLDVADPVAKIEELALNRNPVYKMSSIHIDTDHNDIELIANQLIEKLEDTK